jgi:hypothetical protein
MGIFRTNDPTQFDDIDGIIIDEQAPPASISGVSANVGILVGQFQRGPTELSLPMGSIGELHEIYGKSSFLGNKQLKNKKFGQLRIIRVAPTGAAKATLSLSAKLKFDAKYLGAYGNNLKVTIGDTAADIAALAEVYTILVNNTGSFFDVVGTGKHFRLAGGLQHVWLNVTDGANTQTAPVIGGSTANQVDILTADTAAQIAAKIEAVIEAISGFDSEVSGATITVTHTAAGAVTPNAVDVSAGVTITTTQEGVTAVDAGFKVTLEDTNPGAVLPVEIYDGLTLATITAATFAGSQLMDVTVLDATGAPANAAATALAGGSDGSIVNTDYEAAIDKAGVEKAGNVLFLDEYNATRNGYLKVHAATYENKMVIVCGPEVQTRAAAIADVANYRDNAGNIIYGWPWVQTSIDGALEYTPPAAWIASIFTQVSPHVALSFTGNTQYLAGIVDLKTKESRNGFIALDAAGVCALELDPDVGFLVKNAVCTQILNSSKRTILRRRMAYFLTDSIAQFLKNYQNAVNSTAKRTEVKSAILTFDTTLVQSGIVPGAQDVKSGSPILVDTESLNTDAVVAAGMFKILYKRRIFSSMRYIVLQAEIGESVVVTESEG